MKRLSTRCTDEFINKTEKNRYAEKRSPKKKTLDFLTGFARAYHAESGIQQGLCGIVIN
jgi:hypothetical protein